jgi:hypothetical protein
MSTQSARIVGTAAVDLSVAALTRRVDLAIAVAVRAAAALIADDAKRRIHSRSGRLRAGISVRPVKSQDGRIGARVDSQGARLSASRRGGRRLRRSVSRSQASRYYGAHLEFGHRSPGQGRRIRAYPFMRAASKAARQRVKFLVAQGILTAIAHG